MAVLALFEEQFAWCFIRGAICLVLYSRCVGKAEWDSYSVFGGVIESFKGKMHFEVLRKREKYNLKIEK